MFYSTYLFSLIFRYFCSNGNNAAEWSLLSIAFIPPTLSIAITAAGSTEEPAIRIGWSPLTNTNMS